MAQPLCPYFQHCGGCTLQHLDYSQQLENKKKKLVESILFNEVKVFSDQEYHYRNRMDFIFHQNGLGLRAKSKWFKIIEIKQCPIAHEKINLLLNEINDFFAKNNFGLNKIDTFDLIKHTGTFRFAVVRTTTLDDSSISFVLNSDSNKLAEAIELIKKFAETTSAKNVLITYAAPETDESFSEDYFIIKGNDFLQEKLMEKIFLFPVQGFFQNNSKMAEKMLNYVAELLQQYNTKEAFLLDLYGGVGTFGLTNAEKFLGTTIIESVPSAIEFANKNILENKIKTAKALVLDAKKLFKLPLPKPLYVITDPPRSGMDPKTIQHLHEIKPEVIIYVSCNVEQLAKDLRKFSAYEIKSAALFDLFPQTYHQEAVVELVLRR